MFKPGDRVICLIDFSPARSVAGNYYRNPKRGNLGVVLDDFQSPNGFRMVTLDWVGSGTKLDNLHVHDWPFPDGDAERALELFVERGERLLPSEQCMDDGSFCEISSAACRYPVASDKRAKDGEDGDT